LLKKISRAIGGLNGRPAPLDCGDKRRALQLLDACGADPFSVVASLIRGEFSLPSQLIRL
jgi:hypothetical protein